MYELRWLSKEIYNKPKRPVKVLQYGEGNFLRCFADSFIQELNDKADFNGNILVVTPTRRGKTDKFMHQDSLYTTCLAGYIDGVFREDLKVIDSISDVISPYDDYSSYISYASQPTLKFIISNTTESGIIYSDTEELYMTPPDSFPGKLAQFLYKRFCVFKGSAKAGLTILPCELVDDNGDLLKKTVIQLAERWNCGKAFIEWLHESCSFINTLVDRIVSGYPGDNDPSLKGFSSLDEKLGYHDELLVKGEQFGLWVIDDQYKLNDILHINRTSLPIVFRDCKPYKLRKVRILNGSHTAFAAAALLSGKTYVNEALEDPKINNYLNDAIYKEILPTISSRVPDADAFAEDVLNRFKNPFINHRLASICLNSVSKWEARCLPTIIEAYKMQGSLPRCLTFSLASIISLLSKQEYNITESDEILAYLLNTNTSDTYNLAKNFIDRFINIQNNQIEKQLTEKVTHYLTLINKYGCYEAISKVHTI